MNTENIKEQKIYIYIYIYIFCIGLFILSLQNVVKFERNLCGNYASALGLCHIDVSFNALSRESRCHGYGARRLALCITAHN